MTILAPRSSRRNVGGRPYFETQKEVNQMTNANATDLDFLLSTTRDGVTLQIRPGVVDRAIMRLSVAMLRWARNHADRSFRTWDQLALSNRNALEQEARENSWIPGPHRLIESQQVSPSARPRTLRHRQSG